MTYYINHLLSAQAQAWIALAVLLPIYFVFKTIRICGAYDYRRHKEKCCTVTYTCATMAEIFLGFVISLVISWCIMLLTLFSAWHVAIGCTVCSLVWTLLFCHCNRSRFIHPSIEQEIYDKKHFHIELSPKDESTTENNVKKTQIGLLGHLKTYPKRFALGIKYRLLLVLPVVAVLIGFAIFINLFSCNACICSQPIETSTSFTRKYGVNFCSTFYTNIFLTCRI